MRVIAGRARGRRLAAPKGNVTRPTPDRVREALFSMISGHVHDARVLDLFAGSGALGLEALSRGARSVTFVEQDRRVVEVLRRNIEVVVPPGDGAGGTSVLALPADRALARLAGDEPFDVIFADPPYDRGLLVPTMATVAAHQLLAEGGVMVCEHSGRASPPPPPPGLTSVESRRWGDVAMTLYQREVHP